MVRVYEEEEEEEEEEEGILFSSTPKTLKNSVIVAFDMHIIHCISNIRFSPLVWSSIADEDMKSPSMSLFNKK